MDNFQSRSALETDNLLSAIDVWHICMLSDRATEIVPKTTTTNDLGIVNLCQERLREGLAKMLRFQIILLSAEIVLEI